MGTAGQEIVGGVERGGTGHDDHADAEEAIALEGRLMNAGYDARVAHTTGQLDDK